MLLPSVYHTLSGHVDKGGTTSHFQCFYIILGGTKEHMFSSSYQTYMDDICLYHKLLFLELQYVAVYMYNLIVGFKFVIACLKLKD